MQDSLRQQYVGKLGDISKTAAKVSTQLDQTDLNDLQSVKAAEAAVIELLRDLDIKIEASPPLNELMKELGDQAEALGGKRHNWKTDF